jgi:SAM-dependent methyltransferase
MEATDMSVREVEAYYDENAQKEWERLDNHPFEFIFTTYRMDSYVRPGDSVLDIGGGPGRYAVHYAKKGCDVTLVDLSKGNIELAREKARENGVDFPMFACDCLELDKLPPREYDHVFLMGPLYHLVDERDRVKAVQLALSRLKPGGNLYCSFILDFACVIYDLKNGPGYIAQDLANPATRQLIDSVVTASGYSGPAFTSSCFFHQRQIEPFMRPFGLDKLHLFGQEGIMALSENQVRTFPKEEFDQWIEVAKRFLDLPELLALSEHAMYIGRKPKA